MTTTVTEPATALDILKETRELFAQTHWTSGDLYTTDDKGKKRFCMVGGICHVFAKHNLPEWLAQQEERAAALDRGNPALSFYMQEIEHDRYLKDFEYDRFSAGMDAEWELAKTIYPTLDEDATSEEVETIIVGWNDEEAADVFAQRGNASYVLEVMDATIKRVEEQDAASSE